MFTRSTWFLALFALLGVFSSSAYSQAEAYYVRTKIDGSWGFFVGPFPHDSVDACKAAFGIPTYSFTAHPDICESIGDGVERRAMLTPYFYEDDGLYDPYPETGSYCDISNTNPMCTENQTGDDDGDSIPNVLDEDHPSYNPNYCSQMPSSELCSDGDDSGGVGSGGGDTGGGGSGGGDTGGGLPSSCEGSPTFSESCCFDHAEAQCLDEGGLYDWGYVSVGTPACNFTCNDTVNPPDNGGGDDTGGDSGGSGDGDSGSDDTPIDDTDLIAAVNALQTANQTEFNAIQDDLNTLNQTNQAGFNDVRSAIENIQSPDLTALENSSSQIATNTAAIASNIDSLTSTVSQNSSAEQQLLADLNNSIGTLNSDLNYIANQPFDGANFESQLQGAGTPDDIIASGMGDFESATGIDKDGELESQTINLGDEINKYDPMLGGSSSECPADYSLSIAGAQYSISWTPVCDAFGILSIFVQAAAWFAVPFIVLGVGKK